MKKLLGALLGVFLFLPTALADTTLSSGLTLTIPSQGSRNWGSTFQNNFAQKISEHDHTGSGKGLQISTNAIATNAATDAKIRLTNAGWFKGRNAANSADVNILRVNSADAIEFATAPANVPPSGSIIMFGGSSAPTGWLLCNGAAVSRTTYAALFAVVGTTFGVGDGSTTFNVPDARQKFPLGVAASGTGNALGATGGSIDHTHTVPAHFHGMGTGSDFNITSGGAHTHSIDHDHASVTSAAGSAHTHSIDHDHAAATTDSQGGHSHFVENNDLTTNITLTSSNYLARSYDATNDFSYDLKGSNTVADRGNTSTAGAHTHSVDLPNFTGTSGSESSHTHAVDLPNFTGTSGSTSHTHVTGTMAGRVGLVTGGVDGNAAMTSGATNPPFIALNFIIKQ